ncbi:zinc finger, c3HC4 type (RING finger) domain-containing protein [Ditylenchus destructor]|uniref:Vacuolar protein sorting-associated protein 11 homolog n=1 Tax=Ditylenchus destructor TaxID=166010 RepID=A0AAD4RCK4_9BILA|nr:zinc finger, c3HC4 type (RING finger) domain-containing protein [Ditylenchus destructor]
MPLAEKEWRKFNFFDKAGIQDPSEPNKKFNLQDLNICFRANGTGYCLLGDPNGVILQLSRSFECQLFKAYERSMQDLRLTGDILTTIGEDDNTVPIVKIWDISQWERATPLCKLNSRVNIGKKTVPSTACAIAMNTSTFHGSFIVIGFIDCSVLFYYGDVQRERSLKYRTLRDGIGSQDSTNLIGLEVANSRDALIVFVVTNESMTSHIFNTATREVVRTVSHDVREPSCCFFNSIKNEVIVAGREMVYFYDVDTCVEIGGERGRCYAIAGNDKKIQVVQQGHHLALLTEKPSAESLAANNSLLVCDVDLGYIAFQCPLRLSCQLFMIDEDIFTLDSEGNVSKLLEKPLNAKIEYLVSKNFFHVAIGLARRNKATSDIHLIYKKYGDHLYGKGDFENAIQQYMETIGHVEPSYVITKFLDGPRVSQLCSYLEFIHQKNLATKEHTNLLLGAYLKLNAIDKLAEFVDNSPRYTNFDVDEAIEILRTSNFNKIAAKMALLHSRPDTFLDILIHDTKEYSKALNFIEKLGKEQICNYIEKYGDNLIENLETEEPLVELIRKTAADEDADLQKLTKVLINKPERLESIYSERNKVTRVNDTFLRNTVLENRLNRWSREKTTLSPKEIEEIVGLVDSDNLDQALHLGQMYKFAPLVIHILKKQNRKEEMLRFLLKEGDINDIVQCCGEDTIKNMWIELITYVSVKENVDGQFLISLLKRISETKPNYVHPLVVLEILSRNNALRIGDVKEYIVKWLEDQELLVKKNEIDIHSNEKEIEEMDKAIEQLENSVQVFQPNKCGVCAESLSIPSVHFLCKHSYHEHCFNEFNSDQSDQCPQCARVHRTSPKTDDVTVTASLNNATHEEFIKQLDNCADPIQFISQYIGNGVFDSKINR